MEEWRVVGVSQEWLQNQDWVGATPIFADEMLKVSTPSIFSFVAFEKKTLSVAVSHTQRPRKSAAGQESQRELQDILDVQVMQFIPQTHTSDCKSFIGNNSVFTSSSFKREDRQSFALKIQKKKESPKTFFFINIFVFG